MIQLCMLVLNYYDVYGLKRLQEIVLHCRIIVGKDLGSGGLGRCHQYHTMLTKNQHLGWMWDT